MTRISLKEQYDNSSVIKQIVDLSDEVDETAETAETAKTMATEAGTKADAAKAAADTATAKNTEQDVQIATIQVKDTEQDAQIAAVKTTADAALADVTINTDEISATLLLKNSVESETSKAIPLASENATGMMTKATYAGMIAIGDRVTALEGKTTVVYVAFTSDDPSQSEITNLFTAQTGKAPIAGNQAVDIERSLTYQYNGSEWLKTTQQVAEWTNTTPGLVKGTPAGTENAGTLFAESDGTGSVNGWDDLVARVATNENAISTTIPNTYATKAALGEVESTANDAQTKANGCLDNVTLSEDGKTLTFTKPDDTHIDITIPTRTKIAFEPFVAGEVAEDTLVTTLKKAFVYLTFDTTEQKSIISFNNIDFEFSYKAEKMVVSSTIVTYYTSTTNCATYILNQFSEQIAQMPDGGYRLYWASSESTSFLEGASAFFDFWVSSGEVVYISHTFGPFAVSSIANISNKTIYPIAIFYGVTTGQPIS